MKNKRVLTGMLVMALVFGLVFAGCSQSAGEGEGVKQVVIRITGVSDFENAMVWVFANYRKPIRIR